MRSPNEIEAGGTAMTPGVAAAQARVAFDDYPNSGYGPASEFMPPGPRATDFLPGAGTRATDYLPGGRVHLPPPNAGGYVRGYDGYDADWWLPAQSKAGDSSLDTEFELLSREHPSTASRVERLPLTHGERDMVSFALRKADEFAGSAREWQTLGNRLYTAQIVSAASVPVLIGLMGSFDDPSTDLFLRIVAIFLSIAGSLCAAVESVYMFRARGQACARPSPPPRHPPPLLSRGRPSAAPLPSGRETTRDARRRRCGTATRSGCTTSSMRTPPSRARSSTPTAPTPPTPAPRSAAATARLLRHRRPSCVCNAFCPAIGSTAPPPRLHAPRPTLCAGLHPRHLGHPPQHAPGAPAAP